MNTSTENSSEKLLEKTPEKTPVSVYSVSFSPIVNDEEMEFLMQASRQKNRKSRIINLRLPAHYISGAV